MFKKVCLIATLAFGLFASPVSAQSPQPSPNSLSNLNIAVLDLSSIRRNATVVKSVLEQLNTYRTEFRTRIQKEDAALKTANQELAKQRTLLAPEAFSEERRKFEQNVLAFQKLVQTSKQALDQVNANAMLEVDKALNQVIKKIAEQKNLNLVLRSEHTILRSHSLDITPDVLKELNVILPNLQVQKPVLK